MNTIIRTSIYFLALVLFTFWISCTSDPTKPAIIHLSKADQRLKDSLWIEFFNYRYTNPEKALHQIFQCKVIEDKYDRQISEVNYYSRMVYFFAEVVMIDSARKYTDKQIQLLKNGGLEADNLKAHVYATKAYYFSGREQFDSAVANNLRALSLLKSCPDEKLKLDIADALSLACIRQENFKMAVYYYRPYMEEIKHSSNAAWTFDIMVNIFAMTYDSKNDSLMKIGKHYLFAAKRLADSVKLNNAQPALDYNLATYYFKENNADSGLYYSYRVIDYLKADTQMDNQLQMVYGKIVRYFIDQKQYTAAMAAFRDMQQNTDTATYSKSEKSNYWAYTYELEQHLGTPAAALNALRQQKAIDDEINKYEKNDQMLKYETRMKELENENFVRAREYEAKNQRYYVIFVTIIAIFTFAGSIYIYYYWRKKQLLEKMYWKQLHKRREFEHRNQLLEERTRISREMHDDLGTTLTSTLMAVEMVEMFPEQKEHLNMVRNTANNLHQQVNEIIWNLNTSNDNICSLNNYMISFARKFLAEANISLKSEELLDDEYKMIPSFQRRMIYLSFKELINNIVKHAHATEVKVSIETLGDRYQLSIEDNGVGIDTPPEDPEDVPYGSSGYGLGNISRNISRLFGTVRWQRANASGGTRVDIDMNILVA